MNAWKPGDLAIFNDNPKDIVEVLAYYSDSKFVHVRNRRNQNFSAYEYHFKPLPVAPPTPPLPTAHVWKPGDLAIYDINPRSLVAFVEYCSDPDFVRVSNSYFSFDVHASDLKPYSPPAPTAHHDGQANLSGVPLTLEAAAFDLVPARPASPTLADTLQGIGSWHLANHRAARLDIHLTGHVVGLTLTPIDGRPNRTVKFHAGQSPAFVVGVLDRALALNPENRL